MEGGSTTTPLRYRRRRAPHPHRARRAAAAPRRYLDPWRCARAWQWAGARLGSGTCVAEVDLAATIPDTASARQAAGRAQNRPGGCIGRCVGGQVWCCVLGAGGQRPHLRGTLQRQPKRGRLSPRRGCRGDCLSFRAVDEREAQLILQQRRKRRRAAEGGPAGPEGGEEEREPKLADRRPLGDRQVGTVDQSDEEAEHFEEAGAAVRVGSGGHALAARLGIVACAGGGLAPPPRAAGATTPRAVRTGTRHRCIFGHTSASRCCKRRPVTGGGSGGGVSRVGRYRRGGRGVVVQSGRLGSGRTRCGAGRGRARRHSPAANFCLSLRARLFTGLFPCLP
eukprot:scaffold5945_cov82-Isochrysis_galbana.AAC.4